MGGNIKDYAVDGVLRRDRATAKIASVGNSFPWPIAVGTRLLNGFVNGDVAVVNRWRGYSGFRIELSRSVRRPA